ncbi:ATP-binding cassette domain-containing protein [Streptomyces sp. A7024]|uniref:ABC-type xenobiotic transporter n=1 Tax=Streptomyces coryli TaxID=1128680 RepID=A0A6G4TX88_9ACTN|nr:ATP-binding cassette domain-containing protein [Streptomyces coryli]NGN64595.1 ATP-binding cassette domain-containing protein [Streptomyces coryli]
MSTPAAVLAEGLRKSYGSKRALDGFDLRVPYGTVHGLLGPNGAGKTTAVQVLTTLLRPDGGRALVGGHDVAEDPEQVRRRIGLTGQYAAVDEVLSGRQNLELFGRLFHLRSGRHARGGRLNRRRVKQRAAELLEQFDLTDAANRGVRTYSGGMRRRLDLAASMILAPDVLFLDEPTTGLDPRSRGEVWDAVRRLVAGGTTVLLTTQYLEEADRLADRIAVIHGGRTIADDTPAALKDAVGGDRIEVVVARPEGIAGALRAIARVTGAEPGVSRAELRVHAPVTDRVAALTEVARTLQEDGVEVADLALRRPTLDEVFLHLTGEDGPSAADFALAADDGPAPVPGERS